MNITKHTLLDANAMLFASLKCPHKAQLQDSVLVYGRDVRNGGYAFGQQEKLRLLTYKMIHVCTAGIPHDDGRESLQYLYLYHKISNDEYCRDKGYGP